MAPFKLKFRMGGSRGTSQEVDPDPQVNEALLNHSNNQMGASNSTIDSADCTSLGSIGNEKKSLLGSNKVNNLRLGYLNPTILAGGCSSDSSAVPKSPPPSYEHVLEENTRLANSLELELGSRLTLSPEDSLGLQGDKTNSNLSLANNIQHSRNNSETNTNISFEQTNLTNTCTDPDCIESTVTLGRNNNGSVEKDDEIDDECENSIRNEQEICQDENCEGNCQRNDKLRNKSIDSTEYLIGHMNNSTMNHHQDCNENEDSRACDPLLMSPIQQQQQRNNDMMCKDSNCESGHHTPSHPPPEYSENNENQSNDESDNDCTYSNQSEIYQPSGEQQEIISNKSSKLIYKAVAKQWGITCKMSDQCRCMDCQSHYFDCEFDDNEHQKTDGGLGAGTPMFISEVMHGSACTIL